ncbi:NUDIX domain-containing protein [Deinococcus peraridilitoris]|uniref:ADP-ribose pyrophosphatase n=1 Tax=Deinococcus peraridilitoris (strain DSM 19664 / LMG 22246 / CIP 109416 / KR-200) TaxID=937777 RepID=L0A4T5_DEIPD|nr:NUDIX domain-containing protein [Deinococcus peraridilitoris]AFZ68449.1 ADP-ribose pyrophosphatase [Deinococcus peraridilitoris DSM 19664]
MSTTRPLTTVGALVECDGRHLIVRTTKWRGSWGVPGGKVEYGETLQAALLREFREEVSIMLADVRFALVQEALNSAEFYKPDHFVLLNYLARTDDPRVTPNEEIVEWAWATLEEALEFPLNSFTRTLVEYAREEQARERA